jgi:GUN4-like
VNHQKNVLIGLGILLMLVATELLVFPRLERFRYSSTDRYIPYSDLENIEDILIKQKNFIQADIKTADLVFKVVGKEKVKRVGRLDVPNLSCQYLLQIDDIWKRASNGKFGFTAQSELLDKSNVNRDPSKLEANFREAVGWGKDNSNSLTYPRGYFPYKIYQDDFVVPSFSEKLRECVKDQG